MAVGVNRIRSWSIGSHRLAITGVIVVFSAGGYLLATGAVRSDRKAAAARDAALASRRAQVLLEHARVYVNGLAGLLASQQAAGQRQFAFLVGTNSASFGLVDALWIRGEAGSLIAEYASTITPGVNVSGWPALADPIRSQHIVFGVNATGVGSFGGQSGFYLLESTRFGRGPGSSGYLAVFVPRGWLTLSLGEDPRDVAVRLHGRLLEGRLRARPAAITQFQALAQHWQIARPLPTPTGLQSSLPWIAATWPVAVALLVLLIGRAIVGRRRAERAIERIFDLSPDMLCVTGYDGFFKRLNPAFEEMLGFSRDELLAKPFFDLVHPGDREWSRQMFELVVDVGELVRFENRFVCRDGSVRWLDWNSRPVPGERLIYAAARDITDRRTAEEDIRRAQAALEASRDALQLLADEQAALRRVATLVARGASPAEVFDAVTAEARRLLDAPHAVLLRYERGSTITVIAADMAPGTEIDLGLRLPIEGDSVSAQIKRTGQATGIISLEGASSPAAEILRGRGLRSTAGAPIIVEGELWGLLGFAWREAQPVLSNLEGRMTQFTKLAATAIANAHSRSELAASRARVVAAADETRRRIERDLHDGTQQRLVSLALMLRAANARVPSELGELKQALWETEQGLTAALGELQEISRGIHPAILAKGGLEPALKALARRAPVPMELQIEVHNRFPVAAEVAAYFVVSEAVANVGKHAHASAVTVEVTAYDAAIEIAVSDDGVGGADPNQGSGLLGLRDRMEALGGSLRVTSEPGGGTSLRATIPLNGADPAAAAPDSGVPTPTERP